MPQRSPTLRHAVTLWVAAVLALAAGVPRGWATESTLPQFPRETRIVLTEAQVWEFAEALFRQGEYYRAVSEYQRLLYFFPQGEHTQEARLRIGQAYVLGGEPDQAVRHFDSLLARPDPPSRDTTLYLRGIAWLDRGADRPYSLRIENIQAGLRDFHGVAADSAEGRKATSFLQAMESPHDVPSKSPALAGTLSAALPGAGSVYVRRYAEGALAFFINALLITSTASAFQHDQSALGTVLGAFALAFYGGSIYAAVNGAHKYNDRALADDLDQQRTRFGILLLPGGAGSALQRSF
jgi:tetratricopeptide (TPR) repeat protein